ncbi:DUF6243 family protein [Streptomyces sp. Ru87]|uniref:DUF6243 family protein n=1 Tax=Streptomyces sp. Ru87 TaxID=2044307 RepID=UPI000BF6B573|nr:DUF6243 family protein [Streptomyces sp. Ru87]PGH49599.1 hypothetical protein CRI70_16750 [Streptomyces sp. Ru87]
MAKRNNNLLGVGGQRKKVSRADQQGSAPARAADRRSAAEQKQELLRKMRERVQPDPADRTAPAGQAETADQPDPAASADQPQPPAEAAHRAPEADEQS